ncbi:hypothetical protein ACI1MP_37335 (plasmid) [Kitasatospora griseola]|uniref:hypothetical protein n=1 Tax=Kitasatospora griseola TaxID=2064 RepID=UPI003855B206
MTEPLAGPPDRNTPRPGHRLADHDRDLELVTDTATGGHAGPAGWMSTAHRAVAVDLVLAAREADPPPAAGPAGGPGLGAALGRIAEDVARHRAGCYQEPDWWRVYNRARLRLNSLSRTAITGPKALAMLARFARNDNGPIAVFDTDLEIEGARVFGCLLHLAGHPLSAAFWWRIAAGAGDRTAAFAIYLHHLQHGELDEAEFWFTEGCLADGDGPSVPPAVPPLPGYFKVITTVMPPGCPADNAQPTADLVDEVDRLVVHADPADAANFDGIARRPGPRLASRLEELAGHC